MSQTHALCGSETARDDFSMNPEYSMGVSRIDLSQAMSIDAP